MSPADHSGLSLAHGRPAAGWPSKVAGWRLRELVLAYLLHICTRHFDALRHFVPLVDRLVHAFGFFSVSISFVHATPTRRLFGHYSLNFCFGLKNIK
jgi:hypothetical protein